jgi:hypothetical protein
MSFRKILGLGLFGLMLTMPLMYAAPQGHPRKKGAGKSGGKKGGSKKAPTKGGGRGN